MLWLCFSVVIVAFVVFCCFFIVSCCFILALVTLFCSSRSLNTAILSISTSCLPTYLNICLPTYLPAYHDAFCLPVCIILLLLLLLLFCLSACIILLLFSFLPACLRAYQPACLPVNLVITVRSTARLKRATEANKTVAVRNRSRSDTSVIICGRGLFAYFCLLLFGFVTIYLLALLTFVSFLFAYNSLFIYFTVCCLLSWFVCLIDFV